MTTYASRRAWPPDGRPGYTSTSCRCALHPGRLGPGETMEERNPYAAPTAPLIAADEPTLLSTDPETFEHAGFWIRVGALLLDSLLLSPLGILIFVLLNY